MDETTRAIISSIAIKYEQETVLPGGHKGFVYYNTPSLSPSQLSRLAASALWEDQHVDFDIVVGLAYRGVLFAAALAGGKAVSIYQHDGKIFGGCVQGKRIIIIDDVIVSGKTILEAKLELEKLGAKVVALGCIVNRSLEGFERDLGLPLISAFRTILE